MKNIKKVVLTTLVLSLASASSLSAHSLWVNSFESKPGKTVIGLGWGHVLPIQDGASNIKFKEFIITSPDGKATNLKTPTSVNKDPLQETENLTIYDMDIALQKISIKKEGKSGTYVIKASTKPSIFTKYVNTAGKTTFKRTGMDEIKDIKKVLMSLEHQSVAKSYITIGEWSKQVATNVGLEIIPKTDLSNLRAGDFVEFEVLYNGKTFKNENFLSAKSNMFGQNDGFTLKSNIRKGKAKFRVMAPGQWIVTARKKEEVTNDGKFKELVGKVNSVSNSASLTFNVK